MPLAYRYIQALLVHRMDLNRARYKSAEDTRAVFKP